MHDDLHQMALAATQLANRLPNSVLVSLAGAVAQHGAMDWSVARTAILHILPTAHFRDAAAEFLDNWRLRAAELLPQAVAAALMAVAQAEVAHRQGESVEIVWTGPETTD